MPELSFKRFNHKLIEALTLLHCFDVSAMVQIGRQSDYELP